MSRPANFDGIAHPYRALEYLTLGKRLEQTRLHFLPRLATVRKALVLGDGDGRFLASLFAEAANLEATAIDGSASMLQLLRHRCSQFLDRLKTIHIDALSFRPETEVPYDLVVSHFFLDCFTEEQLDSLITNLRPALRGGSQWLLSDFRIPEGHLGLPAHALVRGLYLAFRLLTGLRITKLPDHISCLSRAGFKCIDRKLYLSGILTTELWELKD